MCFMCKTLLMIFTILLSMQCFNKMFVNCVWFLFTAFTVVNTVFSIHCKMVKNKIQITDVALF